MYNDIEITINEILNDYDLEDIIAMLLKIKSNCATTECSDCIFRTDDDYKLCALTATRPSSWSIKVQNPKIFNYIKPDLDDEDEE